MRMVLVFILLAVAMQVRAAGEPYTVVTVEEGNAALVRDAGRYAFAEGVRLVAGDIVESTAGARLVRIEFADGQRPRGRPLRGFCAHPPTRVSGRPACEPAPRPYRAGHTASTCARQIGYA